MSPALTGGIFTTSATWEAHHNANGSLLKILKFQMQTDLLLFFKSPCPNLVDRDT